MPILTDVARFVGDDIAVVAAVDEETATEALSLIKVEYKVLPFVLDPIGGNEGTRPNLSGGQHDREAADVVQPGRRR